MKIFGREPTAYLELITSLAAILTGLGFTWFTDRHAAAVLTFVAAVAGMLNVIAVRPVAPAVVKLVATTGFGLLAEYGIRLDDRITGVVMLAIVAILALQTRNQVTPAADPAVGGGVSAKDLSGTNYRTLP